MNSLSTCSLNETFHYLDPKSRFQIEKTCKYFREISISSSFYCNILKKSNALPARIQTSKTTTHNYKLLLNTEITKENLLVLIETASTIFHDFPLPAYHLLKDAQIQQKKEPYVTLPYLRLKIQLLLAKLQVFYPKINLSNEAGHPSEEIAYTYLFDVSHILKDLSTTMPKFYHSRDHFKIMRAEALGLIGILKAESRISCTCSKEQILYLLKNLDILSSYKGYSLFYETYLKPENINDLRDKIQLSENPVSIFYLGVLQFYSPLQTKDLDKQAYKHFSSSARDKNILPYRRAFAELAIAKMAIERRFHLSSAKINSILDSVKNNEEATPKHRSEADFWLAYITMLVSTSNETKQYHKACSSIEKIRTSKGVPELIQEGSKYVIDSHQLGRRKNNRPCCLIL